MSELFGGWGHKLVDGIQKVANKTENSLQKVANKTEDIAKQVNRSVNPLSSHFRENERSSETRYKQDEAGIDLDTAAAAGRHSMNSVSSLDSSAASKEYIPSRISLDLQESTDESMSTKRAFRMAQDIFTAIKEETEALRLEKEEYKAVLEKMKKCRQEQEAAFTVAEAMMEKERKELEELVEKLEQESSEVLVRM
mmetsp:Transcript_16165/g.36960  ORF Transcript_16165/g.36960 Transcript_16165/m.36960 type:complete len:196 (-) Transcript_16165:1592-2179(-)